MKLIVHSEEELYSVAEQLIKSFPESRVFCFFGEMGVGKTTFIKEICRYLGAIDTTSSPTFAIVNEYHNPEDEPIYHFDFYRIERLQDAYEIGVDDYFYSGCYCFVEWSENILPLIQPDFVKVTLTIGNHQERIINIEA
jgi:tRNA threonylcarbamoyladenosine biosynthesis protein TsaE